MYESIKSAYNDPENGWQYPSSSHVYCNRNIGQIFMRRSKTKNFIKKLLTWVRLYICPYYYNYKLHHSTYLVYIFIQDMIFHNEGFTLFHNHSMRRKKKGRPNNTRIRAEINNIKNKKQKSVKFVIQPTIATKKCPESTCTSN